MTTHFVARNLTDARLLQGGIVREGDTLTGSLLRVFVLAKCTSEEEFEENPERPGAKIGDNFWEILTKDEEIISKTIRGSHRIVTIFSEIGEA